MTSAGLTLEFRCSMFWAFSLFMLVGVGVFGTFLFRCSIFWAFSLSPIKVLLNCIVVCFDAQCFELFLYFSFSFSDWKAEIKVSMLNVLSFFFILYLFYYLIFRKSFDAQCFELFLCSVQILLSSISMRGFDAQYFELFLYLGVKKSLTISFWRGFDAQYFELFSLSMHSRLVI